MRSEVPTTCSVAMLEVTDAEAGRRLDNYLASRYPELPKALIYRIIRSGEVRVNSGRTGPSYKLVAGDRIRIPPLKTKADAATNPAVPLAMVKTFEANVVFEDARLLVLNKPAGWASHGGSGLKFGAIDVARAARGPAAKIDLVHRLDRETSGCLLFAKDSLTLRRLNRMLADHAFKKTYQALVRGRLPQPHLIVTAPLDGSHRRAGLRHIVVAEGADAADTAFKELVRYSRCSLVQAEPATGRTHQIRVHAAFLQTPLAGDDKYGDWDFNRSLRSCGLKRLFLHAQRLEFDLDHPYDIMAPLPSDLTYVLAQLAES